MSDEPRRVTRSTKRILNEGVGPTKQGVEAPVHVNLKELPAKPSRRGGTGNSRRGGGRSGGQQVQGTETHEQSAGQRHEVEATLAKKRGPPSPNKAYQKPSKAQKTASLKSAATADSGMGGNGKQKRIVRPQPRPKAGKKSPPRADQDMIVDSKLEQATQSKKSSGSKGNKYFPPSLDGQVDSEMSDVTANITTLAGNGADESDVVQSESESERGDGTAPEDGGDVSEPDAQLTAIAGNPTALRAKFAQEQPTFDSEDDSEVQAGDTTVRPDDYATERPPNQAQSPRASSRCSSVSVSDSLHLSQMEISDGSEDESTQLQNVKASRKTRPKFTTMQQTVQVSEKRTEGKSTKREEMRKKEIAKWSDDNEQKEYSKTTRKSSRSQATELKKESRKEVAKREDQNDLDTQTQYDADDVKMRDASIDLVYAADGKTVNLMDQNDYIGNLISRSIVEVQAFIVLDNAYPETDGGLALCASKLTKRVARDLGYHDVLERLKTDLKYQKGLSHSPKERISNFRTVAKRVYEAAIVGGAGLGKLAREDWEKIATGFSYVDPQLPGKSPTARDAKRVYEDPLVAQMLNAIYFSKPSSLGVKFKDRLPEYDGRKAVSNVMVAFVSTGIHAALDRKYAGKTLDISSRMQEIYREHVETLDRLKRDGFARYKKLMTSLYMEATGKSAESSGSAPRALKYIDFDGMDDK